MTTYHEMPPTRTLKCIWYKEYRRPKRDAWRQYVIDENAESSREFFVRSTDMATGFVNWLPDCVSGNQLRLGCLLLGFIGDGADESLMYRCSVVINITSIWQVPSEILRTFVIDYIQKVYTCPFLQLSFSPYNCCI